MKKVNREYEVFLKMCMAETGKDEQTVRQLMSKLKRAENKLHRLFTVNCNEGNTIERDEIQTQLTLYIRDLMSKHKTILVGFNEDPRGGAIRMIFQKTGWYNTMGSDVAVDW